MQKLRYHIALIIGNIAFGANYSIVASLLDDKTITPYSLLYIRVIALALLFFVAMIATRSIKIKLRDIPIIVTVSLFIVLGRVLSLLLGLNLTSPIDGSIIATTNPIVMFVATTLLFHKTISRQAISGLIIAFIGVVLLIYLSSNEGGSSKASSIGNILVFGSVIFSVAGTLITKKLYSRYKFITVLGYSYIFAAIYCAPFLAKDIIAINFSTLPTNVTSELIIYIITGGALALTLYYYGLKGLSAATVSTYIYVQPFIATLMAILRGQDRLSITLLIPSLMIFGGLYLIINRKKN